MAVPLHSDHPSTPSCCCGKGDDRFTRDPAPVFVNELHYDNVGVDQNEAVEIAGSAETDLTGWRLVLSNGSDGRDYFTQELSGLIPDQGGGVGTILIGLPAANLQNGAPDGLASSAATPATATA
jgi:uncharacterized protein